MPSSLRVHTLGRFFAEREGRRLAGAAAQPRRLAILALLAHAGEQGITRDRILALLWPDADEDRGRKGLYQAVYALRQELGDEDAILGSRDLRFNAELVEVDTVRFRAALARGDLAAAVGEYAGPFLDGFLLGSAPEFERWTEEVRAGLARDYAGALEKLGRTATSRGDLADAIGWWRRLAAQDPFNARTAVALMETLVRAGDRAGALQHARIYEALLRQELDLEPDREVLRLAARIREQPEATPIPAPAVPAVAVIEPVSVRSEAPDSESAPLRAQVDDDRVAVHVTATAEALAVTPAPARADSASGPAAGRRMRVVAFAATAVLVAAASAAIALRSPGDVTPPALRGAAAQRITTDAGLELDPALSPDGRFLAYAAGPQNETQLYVRQLDHDARPIAVNASAPRPQRAPHWSPDGRTLAFESPRGVHLVPALGGATTLVAGASGMVPPFSPAWSPDGARLAYVAFDTVMVRAAAGGEPERLGLVSSGHSLAWSPDGRWIAAVEGNYAFSHGSTPGTSGIGNIAPSAILLLPLGGGPPVRITDATTLRASPTWIDARRLAWIEAEGGARDLVVATIGDDGRTVSTPVRLTSGLNAHGVSASAGRLAYSTLARQSNLWSLPMPAPGRVAALGEAHALTSGTQVIESMDLSPDGARLAFDSDRRGNADIYVMPSDGGEASLVVAGTRDDFRPAWSPDGRELAYYTIIDNVRRLHTVPAEGGEPRMARPGDTEEEHSPDWAPDGRRIVFHRVVDSMNQLFVLERRADGGWSLPRQLTRGGCMQGRWSPDGRTIACNSDYRLKRIAADGSDERVLLAPADAPEGALPVYARWSKDGREILYKAFPREGGAPSIWAIPAEGGRPRPLLRFDDPLRTSPRSEFATDGRRLFFTLEQGEGDIWTMPLSP